MAQNLFLICFRHLQLEKGRFAQLAGTAESNYYDKPRRNFAENGLSGAQ
jgi:hypothetical protein